jgi:hypothetical protein
MGLGNVAARLGFVCSSLSLLALCGCSKSTNTLASLQAFVQEPPIPPSTVTVNFCTDPAQPEQFVVKTLVILDHSGSNKENYLMDPNGDGGPEIVNGTLSVLSSYATDPTGILRYGSVSTPGSLLNYLSTMPANNPASPSHYFALIDFNSAVTPYPANGTSFTSDVSAFYNYVQQDSVGFATSGTGEPVDGGDTDYLGALGAAYNVINGDIQNSMNCAAQPTTATPTTACPTPGVQITSAYVILFMSDGSPITSISGVGQTASGQIVITGPISITMEPSSEILGQVETIMGLTSNTKYVAGINMFTVYYYNPTNNIDQNAQTLLANMAKAGNGLAYNAVSGSKIDYSQFVPPQKLIKYTLSDIFVTDSNVTFWDGGTPMLDSDGDGLPDSVETAWGSNPNNADSFGNGVNDMVQYQLANGQPITSPTNYKSGACSSIASTKVNGKLVFNSSDPDGLNDCEKTPGLARVQERCRLSAERGVRGRFVVGRRLHPLSKDQILAADQLPAHAGPESAALDLQSRRNEHEHDSRLLRSQRRQPAFDRQHQHDPGRRDRKERAPSGQVPLSRRTKGV